MFCVPGTEIVGVNDFVKEVIPIYQITEVLPKREEIRKKQ
jgi:hypothetical protein